MGGNQNFVKSNSIFKYSAADDEILMKLSDNNSIIGHSTINMILNDEHVNFLSENEDEITKLINKVEQ